MNIGSISNRLAFTGGFRKEIEDAKVFIGQPSGFQNQFAKLKTEDVIILCAANKLPETDTLVINFTKDAKLNVEQYRNGKPTGNKVEVPINDPYLGGGLLLAAEEVAHNAKK